jgi:hypothetical protein
MFDSYNAHSTFKYPLADARGSVRIAPSAFRQSTLRLCRAVSFVAAFAFYLA